MAKTGAQQSILDLSKGINTEANPLAYPIGYTTEELNFDVAINGTRHKRLGFDYETDYVKQTYTTTELEGKFIDTFVWKDAAKIPNLNFVIQQVGSDLLVYSTVLGTNVSQALLTTLDMTTYLTSSIGDQPFVFASGNGLLFVAGEGVDPVYIVYDPSDESFTINAITIEIRDFTGVDDNLAVDTRPGTLSVEHEYNLLNQGWSAANIINFKDGYTNTTTNTNESAIVWTGSGVYPSNADIEFLGRGNFATSSVSVSDVFQPRLLERQIMGNTPAPKGHFVLNYFTPNRGAASGLGTLPDDPPINNRPAGLCFAFGRIFYGVANTILFSQLLQDDPTKAGYCYQDADPTSEHVNDLIATDGGEIILHDAGIILRMELVGKSIVIVATNGVYTLSGTDLDGFSAVNYQVNKISSVGGISNTAILAVADNLLYLSSDGINVLRLDKITLSLVPESLTDQTIKTFYQSIPVYAKRFAKLVYDVDNNKVYMIYNSRPVTSGIRSVYDSMLMYHPGTGGFYPWHIPAADSNTGPFITGFFIVPGVSQSNSTFNVVCEGEQVIVGTDDVLLSNSVLFATNNALKFTTVVKNGNDYELTMGEFKDTSFVDWDSEVPGGVAYEAYLQTGDLIPEIPEGRASSSIKAVPMMGFYFKTTESKIINKNGLDQYDRPSSAYVKLKFNATTSSLTNRWSGAQQVYRLPRAYWTTDINGNMNPGETQIATKTFFRGSGRSFSVRLDTEAGKDCQLIGFDYAVTAGTRL